MVEAGSFDQLEDIDVDDYWGTVIIIAFTELGIGLGSLAGRAIVHDAL